MPLFSIVVGYRDREVERVQRFLDSLQSQEFDDFECIVVDYGSSDDFAGPVKNLCAQYGFCNYIYSHTRGWFWNRSHASNTGFRAARGEYIISTDIDMIFSNKVLLTAAGLITPEHQIFSRVYKPDQSFTEYSSLTDEPPDFDLSGENGLGGFHCVSREKINALRGFDEFYCIWGKEDEDLALRLDRSGLQRIWLDHRKFPIYHQWHPQSTVRKSSYPRWWWDQVYLHFILEKENITRNDASWGRLVELSDRPVLTNPIDNTLEIAFELGLFNRGKAYAAIIEEFKLHHHHNVEIRIGPKKSSTTARLADAGNKLISRSGLSYMMMHKNVLDKLSATSFLGSFILYLKHNSEVRIDYCLEYRDDEIERALIYFHD